jgi:hypothetical protein
MPECACGCGQQTKGGTFLPGHDAKLRARIEESVGGLLQLNELVGAAQRFASGQLSAVDYHGITLEVIGAGRKS